MKIKVDFNDKEGRFNIPSFILRDNEGLDIEFALPIAKNLVYIANISNGKTNKRISLSTHLSVALTPEWLKECKDKLTIDLSLRDRSGLVVYKKYNIEPLNIVQENADITATASIQDLEMRLQVAEMKIKAVEEFIRAVPMIIENAKKEAVIEAAGGDPMGA